MRNFLISIKDGFIKNGANKQNMSLIMLFALLLPVSCLFKDNILLNLNFFLIFIPCSAVAHFNLKFFLDNPVRFRNFIIFGFTINLIITLIIWGCF